ncbi:MAG TPA: GAF domain-containing protein, partial [Polyangiaceae bacterium]|nr:GAF domain-containing protein [Polyangiaceae bacterium]
MELSGLGTVGDRLEALLETMRAFAEAATDSQTLLSTITERVTRLMGDGCSIYVMSEDGEAARPVALTNRSEERAGAVQAHFGRQALRVAGKGPIARSIREGQPVRIPLVDARALGQDFREEDGPLLAGVELRSLLVVPLQVRGATIGAL